jgi:hypothetical protein
MAQTWYNSDGLYIKYGTAEGTAGAAGEYSTLGPRRFVELTINDATLIPASPAVIEDNVWLPSGVRIEEVHVISATTVTSGGVTPLNVGLIREDRSTELDYDGLVAALAKATYATAGTITTLTVGVSGAGALIGTTLANKGYLTVDYDTNVPTAGKLIIRVYYSVVTT